MSSHRRRGSRLALRLPSDFALVQKQQPPSALASFARREWSTFDRSTRARLRIATLCCLVTDVLTCRTEGRSNGRVRRVENGR